MKKHLIFLLLTSFAVFFSCSKDEENKDNPPKPEECIKKDIATTLVGKWIVGGSVVTFNSDKSYLDPSKKMCSCESGKWGIFNSGKLLEFDCGTNLCYHDVLYYSCDTVKLTFINLYRQK